MSWLVKPVGLGESLFFTSWTKFFLMFLLKCLNFSLFRLGRSGFFSPVSNPF